MIGGLSELMCAFGKRLVGDTIEKVIAWGQLEPSLCDNNPNLSACLNGERVTTFYDKSYFSKTRAGFVYLAYQSKTYHKDDTPYTDYELYVQKNIHSQVNRIYGGVSKEVLYELRNEIVVSLCEANKELIDFMQTYLQPLYLDD